MPRHILRTWAGPRTVIVADGAVLFAEEFCLTHKVVYGNRR